MAAQPAMRARAAGSVRAAAPALPWAMAWVTTSSRSFTAVSPGLATMYSRSDGRLSGTVSIAITARRHASLAWREIGPDGFALSSRSAFSVSAPTGLRVLTWLASATW